MLVNAITNYLIMKCIHSYLEYDSMPRVATSRRLLVSIAGAASSVHASSRCLPCHDTGSIWVGLRPDTICRAEISTTPAAGCHRVVFGVARLIEEESKERCAPVCRTMPSS